MYVCICRGITDTRIRSEVASGATTMRELGRRLGIATHCGQCGPHARAVLGEAIKDIVHGDSFRGEGVPCEGTRPAGRPTDRARGRAIGKAGPDYWEPAA